MTDEDQEAELRDRHHRTALLVHREEYMTAWELLQRAARGAEHLREFVEFLEFNAAQDPAPALIGGGFLGMTSLREALADARTQRTAPAREPLQRHEARAQPDRSFEQQQLLHLTRNETRVLIAQERISPAVVDAAPQVQVYPPTPLIDQLIASLKGESLGAGATRLLHLVEEELRGR
ncbi:hypothetical protein BOO71_0002374 [Deinococcus marmoris]|uniref:Uncharacterized protein n=1 Tax=Deinococcus marmoris TaxID=249408 RepID=A0A1U7P2Y9_9DEIO|nr:hypothetical protein BOO71_0002374 [Deinococcus marmoris]